MLILFLTPNHNPSLHFKTNNRDLWVCWFYFWSPTDINLSVVLYSVVIFKFLSSKKLGVRFVELKLLIVFEDMWLDTNQVSTCGQQENGHEGCILSDMKVAYCQILTQWLIVLKGSKRDLSVVCIRTIRHLHRMVPPRTLSGGEIQVICSILTGEIYEDNRGIRGEILGKGGCMDSLWIIMYSCGGSGSSVGRVRDSWSCRSV